MSFAVCWNISRLTWVKSEQTIWAEFQDQWWDKIQVVKEVEVNILFPGQLKRCPDFAVWIARPCCGSKALISTSTPELTTIWLNKITFICLPFVINSSTIYPNVATGGQQILNNVWKCSEGTLAGTAMKGSFPSITS